MNSKLIIIPTYNEAENILLIIKEILERFPNNFEILVVDDGSPDNTGNLVKELSENDTRIHVLQRSGKMGLASAYIAGFKWGLEKDYTHFIEMDADFSHPPKELSNMLNLSKNNDVIIGSRYIKGGGVKNWNLFRRFISKFGGLYARTILPAPINDFTGGFNGWSRKVLETIQLDNILSDGYLFQIELKYRAFLHDFKIVEFPFIFDDRREGQSKMGARIFIEAVLKIWILKFKCKK